MRMSAVRRVGVLGHAPGTVGMFWYREAKLLLAVGSMLLIAVGMPWYCEACLAL